VDNEGYKETRNRIRKGRRKKAGKEQNKKGKALPEKRRTKGTERHKERMLPGDIKLTKQ
jgi:hypothetical protein